MIILRLSQVMAMLMFMNTMDTLMGEEADTVMLMEEEVDTVMEVMVTVMEVMDTAMEVMDTVMEVMVTVMEVMDTAMEDRENLQQRRELNTELSYTRAGMMMRMMVMVVRVSLQSGSMQ